MNIHKTYERRQFAAQIMAGFAVNATAASQPDDLAEDAVTWATELAKELDKVEAVEKEFEN
jgi:hypothetical protein